MRPNAPFAHALTALVVASLMLAPAAAAGGAADARQTYDYRFSWNAFTFDAPDASNETQEGTSTNATIPIQQVNVTALRFSLEWEDDVGEPDTLRMVVYDPSGEERARASDTQENGTLEVLVRLQEVPPGTVTVRATSDDEAWSVFRTDYPPTQPGTGAWRVEVTVLEAGDQDGNLVGIGEQEDTGQAWDLRVDGGAYVGVLDSRTPVDDPEDEPDPAPDEMPPPDADDNETVLPEESTGGGATSILASKGAQSALVVAAAAIGIAAALLVARKSGARA